MLCDSDSYFLVNCSNKSLPSFSVARQPFDVQDEIAVSVVQSQDRAEKKTNAARSSQELSQTKRALPKQWFERKARDFRKVSVETQSEASKDLKSVSLTVEKKPSIINSQPDTSTPPAESQQAER